MVILKTFIYLFITYKTKICAGILQVANFSLYQACLVEAKKLTMYCHCENASCLILIFTGRRGMGLLLLEICNL